jgi:hypothetical protein
MTSPLVATPAVLSVAEITVIVVVLVISGVILAIVITSCTLIVATVIRKYSGDQRYLNNPPIEQTDDMDHKLKDITIAASLVTLISPLELKDTQDNHGGVVTIEEITPLTPDDHLYTAIDLRQPSLATMDDAAYNRSNTSSSSCATNRTQDDECHTDSSGIFMHDTSDNTVYSDITCRTGSSLHDELADDRSKYANDDVFVTRQSLSLHVSCDCSGKRYTLNHMHSPTDHYIHTCDSKIIICS